MTQKTKLIEHIQGLIQEKVTALNRQIIQIQEAQQDDTKSSAGDKFETGREMLQAELNKYALQKAKLEESLGVLASINTQTAHSEVELGSLVQTTQADYFIAIGLGHLQVEGQSLYVISLASPLGKALHHKRKGESFVFQNKTILIQDVS